MSSGGDARGAPNTKGGGDTSGAPANAVSDEAWLSIAADLVKRANAGGERDDARAAMELEI